MASSGNFLDRWRRHAAYDRIGFWLQAHAYYLQRLEEITVSHARLSTTASSAALLADVDEFESFLQAHSEREEHGMFRFLAQTFPAKFADTARTLIADHAGYDAKVDALKRALASRTGQAEELLRARQKELREHFQIEEETCVPLMLGLTDKQYADYQVMAFGKTLQIHQLQEMEKFPGVGYNLRDSSTNVPSLVATVQPVELKADATLPTTSVRVRFASGASVTVKANPQSTTVTQLHQHVAWLMIKQAESDQGSDAAAAAGVQRFDLKTAFPPPRSLASEGPCTLQEAGLLNATLLQEVYAGDDVKDYKDNTKDSKTSVRLDSLERSQSLQVYVMYAIVAVLVLALAFLCRS